MSARGKKLQKIVLVGLLKHLRANNEKMFKAAIKQRLLESVNKDMVEFIVEVNGLAPPPQ